MLSLTSVPSTVPMNPPPGALRRPHVPFGVERQADVALRQQSFDLTGLRRECGTSGLQIEDHVHVVGLGGVDPRLELRHRNSFE